VIRPSRPLAAAAIAILLSFSSGTAEAQFVPGRGQLLTTDNFEGENWGFNYNLPKSSKEEDEQVRYPVGASTNGRWKEGPKRGCPDVVKVVDTPPDGIEGSAHALLLRTKDTGIPGRLSYSQKQDDFVMVSNSMGLGSSPSCTVRVYLPPFEDWENRAGVSFGMRLGLQGPQWKTTDEDGNIFSRRPKRVVEPYYPGFFIVFNPKETAKDGKDSAQLLIRASESGHDIPSIRIDQTGWWTFGMSVTPDARVHYYASPGVDDLTEQDLIKSTHPYSIGGTHFNTMFFNICNGDDGKTWSTPWIIDDPKIFWGQTTQPQRSQIAQEPKNGGIFGR
jgi:hypothetical protein